MSVSNPFQPWTYQPPKPSKALSELRGHPPIWYGPVKGPPLPKSVIEEILKEYREAMSQGKLPIAYGPSGLVTVPTPTSTPKPQPPRALSPTPPVPTPTPPSPPTRVTPPIGAQPFVPPTPRTATPTPTTAQPTPPPFVIVTELGLTPPPAIPNIPPHILLNLPELELTPEELARLLRRPRLLAPA